MSDFSLGVIIVSMIGSGLTVILSVRASIKLTSWAGSPLLRLVLVLSAIQALAYFFAYWWLLNHPARRNEWISAIRPLQGLSWFLGPWLTFPIALEFHLKNRAKLMKTQALQMIQEVQCEGGSNGAG